MRRSGPYFYPHIPCRQGGEVLKKRRESYTTKACLDYLRVLENSGKIAWTQRMNSGAIPTSYGGRKRIIKLCRPGTADIYVWLNNGRTLWIENKKPEKDIDDKQKEFKVRMEKIGDIYITIRSLNELIDMMSFLIKEA